MKTLKLKIFDVLTEKITVSEFENWLYTSNEVIESLGSNNYYFDIISINYKSQDWDKKLKTYSQKQYHEDFIEILSIKQACLKILNANNNNEIYQAIEPYLDFRDYNTDYTILLRFYDIEFAYNSFQYSVFDKEGFAKEAKNYARQVIENLNKACNLKEKKEALKLDLKPF